MERADLCGASRALSMTTTSVGRRAKKLPHQDLVDRNRSERSAKLGYTRWPQYFLSYSFQPFSN
jgi:hypothetical protein